MEIESSDFDDFDNEEVEDISDDEIVLDSDDNSEELFVKPEKSKLEIRRRLEEYLEDAKLRRELDLY